MSSIIVAMDNSIVDTGSRVIIKGKDLVQKSFLGLSAKEELFILEGI